MDGGAHGGGGNGGGGGGPAPFLLKTYEMVDDASTDDIVSWSSTNASFVVWNPPDFAASLLPTYFKHNNFSSFIRQLNTYGFKKIDPERWEFANDEFIKGQKHLLKNIHRRKPIHSHSHPPVGGLAVAERAALEEEIERLNREKSGLEANLWRFSQQVSGTEGQMEDLERRLADLENRQLKIVTFLQRAMQKPQLMQNLLQMAGTSPMDISAIHKKRRLPADIQEASVNSFDTDPYTFNKPQIGDALDKDFCNKLRLELRRTPDDDLLTTGTQIDEGTGDLQARQADFDHELIECLPLIPETSQLCHSGTPISATEEGLFVRRISEGSGAFPSHLSLSLSWTTVQHDSKTSDLVNQVEANTVDLQTSAAVRDNDPNISVMTSQTDSSDVNLLSFQEVVVPTSDDPVGENDIFWQQFLTERPGSSVVEEKDSLLTANASSYEHNEESKPGKGDIFKGKRI